MEATPERTRSFQVSRPIAAVFALGVTPSTPHQSQLALSQHGSENRKSDLGSGLGPLLGQKQWAITHSVATKNTIPMVPLVLQCSLSAVADNPPSAAFWFDPKSRDVRKEEEEQSGDTGCRLSRYRHPERSLSRGRNLLAGSAVLAAHYPLTGPARWLRDQSIASTGCSSEGQHAQNGWPHPPRKLSPYSCAICASIPTPQTGPWFSACSCLGSCCLTLFSVMGPAPDQPRLQGNLLCRKDWIQLREIARSEWAILPVQEVAAYPWCAECKPLRSSTSDASGRQGPCRMAPMAWCRTPRQCQRLRIRTLRPGRARTFHPAPAQHDIPIDGLFSFTLPCAIQNTWACCLSGSMTKTA